MIIMLCDFLMFDQIFFSPNMKRSGIIRVKHDKYEIASQVAQRIKTKDLRKLGNIRKNFKTP